MPGSSRVNQWVSLWMSEHLAEPSDDTAWTFGGAMKWFAAGVDEDVIARSHP